MKNDVSVNVAHMKWNENNSTNMKIKMISYYKKIRVCSVCFIGTSGLSAT